MAVSTWLCRGTTRSMLVKIVFPGGRVEFHDQPVMALDVMKRHPKCCIAYPEVFRQPWAVASPGTVLMLGHKYYVVPNSTLRKLRRKALRYQVVVASSEEGSDASSGANKSSSSSMKVEKGIRVSVEAFLKVWIGRAVSKQGGRRGYCCIGRNQGELPPEGSPAATAVAFHWQPKLKSISEERDVDSRSVTV